MACKCVSLTNEALAKYNAQLNLVVFIDGQPARPEILTSLIEKRRSQRAPTIVANFCPFCGVAYGRNADDIARTKGVNA